MKKTVTIYGATGVAGSACVDEMLELGQFEVQVLLRQGQDRDRSTLGARSDTDKQSLYARWRERGVRLIEADVASHASLIPALRGTDYLVSCAPYAATESQYALIYAAREAGVERFVPSEFGFIYEWEQFWPAETEHRAMARQKAFIRRVIELAGMDYTIIPAGLWIEYYMLEPVAVMGDGTTPMSWSSGRDVGRIIPMYWRTPPRATQSARWRRRPTAAGTNCWRPVSVCLGARSSVTTWRRRNGRPPMPRNPKDR